MVPNLLKLSSRLKQEPPPAPPTPSRNKIQILEKHRKEFCDKVLFSHLSHHLLTSEYLSKEDAYEICLLPLPQQMGLCHNKILEALTQPNREGRTDLWTLLLRALNGHHSGLTVKLDTDLHKLSKRAKPCRLRKEDIGVPQDFKHLKHIGHTPSIPSTPNSHSYASKSNPFRRFFSLRSTSSSSPPSVSSLFPGNLPLKVKGPTSPGDEELVKEFLQKAGVTEFHLRKPGSRKLILDFIEKNGGMDAIRKEILRQNQVLPPEDEGIGKDGDNDNSVHLVHVFK